MVCLFILLVSLLYSSFTHGKDVPADPDVGKSMTELIEGQGYSVETHFVTTKDGYILKMFRIPKGKHASTIQGTLRRPVILQHGLVDSSFTWVSNFDHESLSYILANQGYDVWMGNNRGNRYSRNHTTLNPDEDEEFWNFSWDEMALYDIPAMVEYVSAVTGHTSIGYVGHSEGTTQMFAAASSVNSKAYYSGYDEQYLKSAVDKVSLFVALAPACYITHIHSKSITYLANNHLVEKLYDRGIFEVGKHDDQLNTIAPELCEEYVFGCDGVLRMISGPSLNLNISRLQVYVSGTPAGTSTINMLHWEQMALIPNFQMLDRGEDENVKYYGSGTPPLYNLSAISTDFKIAIFSGGNDYLATPIDVDRARSELPHETVVFDGYNDGYAHLDYTWAYNANVLVYSDVVRLLHEYV